MGRRPEVVPAVTDLRRASPEASTTDALLRELIDQLIGLRADARDRRPSPLTRQDRDPLARILPVVIGVCGSELFTARELVEDESADLRLVLAGQTPKRLGRLLQRAEGQRIGGFVVQRDGLEVGAVLWRIVAAA
jgi:hypothetical protein